ncbi:MAG: sugar transferase [Faecalibacterium prausnitzii]
MRAIQRSSPAPAAIRHPGLSCYWQIAPHRNEMSFDEWVALDLKYIQERSFWVDWKIIFLTVRAMLMKYGE